MPYPKPHSSHKLLPFLDEERLAEHQSANMVQSYLLIAGIGAVLLVTAWLLAAWNGVIIALIALAFITLLRPKLTPKLLMRLYKAEPIDPLNGGQFVRIVEVLADRAELPAHPKLYVVPSMMLNAFAAGTTENSFIAITEGMMRKLNTREIAGVIAHEISHIRNNDLAVMGLADVMSRLTLALSYAGMALAAFNLIGLMGGEAPISWFAIALLYFAPTAGSLLQLKLSRTREYDADLEAANLIGDPTFLADALKKLDSTQGKFWEDFALPVPGRKIPYPSLLRSHPSTADRLERLAQIKPPETMPPLIPMEEPMISLVGLSPGEMRARRRWHGLWY